MGQDFETQGSDGNTYILNVCGTSDQQCPNDAGIPPVTSGTAVQLTSDLPNGCYVLGDYENDNCVWTANPGGEEGIELVVEGGSDPRKGGWPAGTR